jgi:hypothetical protein
LQPDKLNNHCQTKKLEAGGYVAPKCFTTTQVLNKRRHEGAR